jgi:hypothetical protein
MVPQRFGHLDVPSQPRIARVLQEMSGRQDLRESPLDRKVAQVSHTVPTYLPREIADLMWTVPTPWKLTEGLCVSPHCPRCLGLRIENSVQATLNDLFPKFLVALDVNSIDDDPKASQVPARQKVKQFLVIVATRADIESQGIRYGADRARAR